MLYCCETCGEKFISEEKALECEQIHREEKARREELAKEKNARVKEINEKCNAVISAVKEYEKDYKEVPVIKFADKSDYNMLRSLMDARVIADIFRWL